MNAPTAFGNLASAQDVAGLSVAGYGGVAIQATGTFSGTLSFEASTDGENFRALLVTPSNSATQVSSSTAVGLWFANVTGLLMIRVRMSAFASGVATVRLKASEASPTAPPGSGGGGGGGTSSAFGDSFPATGTAAGFEADDGTMAPVVLEADGSLPVTIVGGGGSGGTSSTFGAAFPSAGTAVGVADPDGNMHALSAETLDYDSGAGSAPQSIIGIALPASGGPVAGGTATNPFRTDPTGTTTQPVSNAGTFAVQNTAATPAGTNLIGRVASSDETSTIYNGTTALTPKYAVIAAASSGNNTLVAAVTSKKIRVLGYNFIANGTVNAKFQSGASGTDLTGLKYCVANMGLSASYNPVGWFESASGVLLNLNLSGAVAVGGELVYVEV